MNNIEQMIEHDTMIGNDEIKAYLKHLIPSFGFCLELLCKHIVSATFCVSSHFINYISWKQDKELNQIVVTLKWLLLVPQTAKA